MSDTAIGAELRSVRRLFFVYLFKGLVPRVIIGVPNDMRDGTVNFRDEC
jgi:hypothetical protein